MWKISRSTHIFLFKRVCLKIWQPLYLSGSAPGCKVRTIALYYCCCYLRLPNMFEILSFRFYQVFLAIHSYSSYIFMYISPWKTKKHQWTNKNRPKICLANWERLKLLASIGAVRPGKRYGSNPLFNASMKAMMKGMNF